MLPASRPFKLGGLVGWTANLIGLSYVIVTTVLFLFPPDLPVTGSNMSEPSFPSSFSNFCEKPCVNENRLLRRRVLHHPRYLNRPMVRGRTKELFRTENQHRAVDEWRSGWHGTCS